MATMEAEANERDRTRVAQKETKSSWLFPTGRWGRICRKNRGVPESPISPLYHTRRRDKVEFAVTVLLLTGLLGLLAAGARHGPGTPGPAASPAPSGQPAYARIAVPSVVNSRPPVTTTWPIAVR